MKAAETLAQRMIDLREAAGFSQEDEAARLGIKRPALSHYETGRRQPDYATLVAFADLHGVTVDFLLGREVAADVR